MFGYTTIKSVVGKDVALSGDMINSIDRWKAMYSGNAPWISDSIESLGLERSICREFADISVVEMEASIDDEDMNEVFQKMRVDLNEKLKKGLALGTLVIRPLGPDKFEYITADKIVPISFDDDGNPIDIGFFSVKRVGENDYYTRFERHYFENGNLTISNKCYHSQSESYIGNECEMTSVPEWENINPGPVTYLGMDKMDFGFYKNPIDNIVDESACGVSVFESSWKKIRKADKQAARLDWEYESGERAIHVDDRALRHGKNGASMAKLNKRLYRGLNIEAGKDTELLKEYSPDMRDESFDRGLDRYLRDIEFDVGLAYGDLSNPQSVEKTATEVRISKQRKYNRVSAIQCKLEYCLKGFVDALAFYSGKYTSSYEFSCVFNDSILVDDETQRKLDREEVAMGAMSMVEYRMKWYGEDEETARSKIQEQQSAVIE